MITSNQKKRIAMLEFPLVQGGIPIASGYLETFARANKEVDDHFEFSKHSLFVDSPEVPQLVADIDADIYTFSCYVWNMGLVRRLLESMKAQRPDAYFLLGGPQVMKKGERYLKPEHERLMLCDGEGERTFANFLLQLTKAEPDFAQVKGLSFYSSGELVTTATETRLRNLDAIPSPYLNGCFDDTEYSWAVIETNRGCPFKCTYCYWGAATNVKVHKFGHDRIIEELTWLSQKKVMYILFADANFGLYARDIEIAEHLADLKSKYGFPLVTYFSSSKNTPERVCKISEILDRAGLIATQPISMQTMSETVLKHVKRSNIKPESYTELQKTLNTRGASSFIELIWPLPGETLSSYQAGIGALCEMRADAYSIYPLLLINNVEMQEQREEFKFQTIDDPNPNSEAEIVVATKDVDFEVYKEGLRISYNVIVLYSIRGLWFVGRDLHEKGHIQYSELFADFKDYCASEPHNAYVNSLEKIIHTLQQSGAMGTLAHVCLHSNRLEFMSLLRGYIDSKSWGNDDRVQVLLELDFLNHPHLYRNTPIEDNSSVLNHFKIKDQTENGYVVSIPAEHIGLVRQKLGLADSHQNELEVNYKTSQLPYMASKSFEEHYSYCEDRLRRIRSILPVWSNRID